MGLYPLKTDDSIDYDGTIRVVGHSIVIVVPAPEISTADWAHWWAGFWKKFVTGLSVALIATAVGAGCLAFFNEAPAAAPVCGAVAGGLRRASAKSSALPGQEADRRGSLGPRMGSAIWGAVVGGFGGALVQFASARSAAIIADIQTTLKRWATVYKFGLSCSLTWPIFAPTVWPQPWSHDSKHSSGGGGRGAAPCRPGRSRSWWRAIR